MRTLYCFELKKIARQKILWVAILIMTAILLMVGLTDVIAGRASIAKNNRQFSGWEIDDALLGEVQNSESQEDFFLFRNFITACMGTNEYGTVTAEQVYAAREAYNNKQMEVAGLTDEEKAYWEQKEVTVKKPVTYQYEEGFAGIFTSVYIANFMLLLLVAIGVSGIFADEKQSGTDQIIFSSVNKEKLFGAKILAGLSVGILLALFFFGIAAACSFGIYGVSGFDAPIQIRIPGCMLNITIGQAWFFVFVLFLLAGITYSSFVMFLSQVLHQRSAATAIMVLGLFSSMINVPEKLGVISLAWSYLPGAYIGTWTFTEYRLVHVFGKYFNNLQTAPVFWMISSVVFLLIAGIAYMHYQVKGK